MMTEKQKKNYIPPWLISALLQHILWAAQDRTVLPYLSSTPMQIANKNNERFKQQLCTRQTIHKLEYLSKSFAGKLK